MFGTSSTMVASNGDVFVTDDVQRVIFRILKGNLFCWKKSASGTLTI